MPFRAPVVASCRYHASSFDFMPVKLSPRKIVLQSHDSRIRTPDRAVGPTFLRFTRSISSPVWRSHLISEGTGAFVIDVKRKRPSGLICSTEYFTTLLTCHNGRTGQQ